MLQPPLIEEEEEDLKSSVFSEKLGAIESRQDTMEATLATMRDRFGQDQAEFARAAAIMEHITDELSRLAKSGNSDGAGRGQMRFRNSILYRYSNYKHSRTYFTLLVSFAKLQA